MDPDPQLGDCLMDLERDIPEPDGCRQNRLATERRNGYLRLARKLFDGGDLFWPTPFKDRFSKGEAWVDLIQMAAFRDGAVVNGVRLNRGEVCGSIRWFARRWSWTEKEVRGFLVRCEGNRRIRARIRARTWARTPSVYVLVNYSVYNPENGKAGTVSGADPGTDGARTGHNDEEGNKRRSTTSREGASRQTWLSPYWDAWQAAYGGIPNGGLLSKALKPLHDQHGEAETLHRWKYYLSQTPAEYANPHRFASTWGRWDPQAEPLSELGFDEEDFDRAPR